MDSNFRNLVSANPKLQAAFHSFTDKIAAEVQVKYGVAVDKSVLAELTAVKVVTLSNGDESLGDTWEKELIHSNSEVQQAIKIKELAAAFADEGHANHNDVHEDWNRLSIHQRMARAREMDRANGKPKQKVELTDAEKKQAIHEISTLRGGAKIAAARKYNLQ